jgi:hypothetical protein
VAKRERAGEGPERPAQDGHIQVAGGDRDRLHDRLESAADLRFRGFLPFGPARAEKHELAHDVGYLISIT